MLLDNSINEVRLITNNPEKINALEQAGIKIKEIVKLNIEPNNHNKRYIDTKKAKLHHSYY